MHLNRQTKINL